MRLLRDLDYQRAIQDSDLLQIIESNDQIKLDVEQSAQAEIKSYLAQRYQTDRVLSGTTVFDETVLYYGNDLVEYTADAFSASSDYNRNDVVLHSGSIYKALATVTAGAWDANEWELICTDKTLFYVTLPYSEYDPATTYAVGDKVWFRDKIYTNSVACTNILPTESGYWGTGVEYSFSGILPYESDYWTQGDNRNQLIVMYLLDMVIFHMLTRIQPRNIPKYREERYIGRETGDTACAIGWLRAVAKGAINADLPVILPEQGLSMRYGNAGDGSPSKNMMW